MEFLNRVFTAFDRLVERHGPEKIKTTGDAYMVVSGVPVPRSDHAPALAQLALEMRDVARDLKHPHGSNVPIRIGVGSGPVVAGVVGTRKFFYDVWGDAVNVASRMETTGIVGKIQVAQETYERLKDDFVLEDCGEIDVRGKGRMRTWFLVERKRRWHEPGCAERYPDADAARGDPHRSQGESSSRFPLDDGRSRRQPLRMTITCSWSRRGSRSCCRPRSLAWVGGRLSPSRWFRLRTFLRLPVVWPHAYAS